MKARVKSGSLKMNKEVREALEAEADRMAKEAIAEMNRDNEEELDAMVLYILHEEFGFGEKRLRRFYEDRLWLCQKKLREAGIDISKWKGEKEDECAG